MIECKICRHSFKTLTASHLTTHDIDVAEYKKKFRVKYIHSKQARIKIGKLKIGNTNNLGRKFNLKPERLIQLQEHLIALNKSPKKRRLISKIMKGNKNASGLKHSTRFKKTVGRRLKKLWSSPYWRRKTIKAQNAGKIK